MLYRDGSLNYRMCLLVYAVVFYYFNYIVVDDCIMLRDIDQLLQTRDRLVVVVLQLQFQIGTISHK